MSDYPNRERVRQSESCFLLLGAYAQLPEHGIGLLEFNARTGQVKSHGVLAKAPNPSFLAIDPTGEYVYANYDRNPGMVAAYRFHAAEKRLEQLNIAETGAPGATHLCVNRSRTCLAVANYAGHAVSTLHIRPDGSLGEIASLMHHTGRGPHPTRQEAPHPHGVYFSPDEGFVLCTDLGTDGIHVYAFDAATARLTPVEPLVQVAQGAGVRHGTFDPSGRRFYVINELDATITGFAWEASTGKLEAISSVSTLPQPVEGNLTAELEFHPNGKFLYGSNRGHNSLAIYAVEPATGHLTPLGHTEIGAAEPRHFHIHPSGDWLITADQKASQVSVFQINPSTGALTHTGITCPTHQPVCVLSVV